MIKLEQYWKYKIKSSMYEYNVSQSSVGTDKTLIKFRWGIPLDVELLEKQQDEIPISTENAKVS
jgi:hypothetical protein